MDQLVSLWPGKARSLKSIHITQTTKGTVKRFLNSSIWSFGTTNRLTGELLTLSFELKCLNLKWTFLHPDPINRTNQTWSNLIERSQFLDKTWFRLGKIVRLSQSLPDLLNFYRHFSFTVYEVAILHLSSIELAFVLWFWSNLELNCLIIEEIMRQRFFTCFKKNSQLPKTSLFSSKFLFSNCNSESSGDIAGLR